LREREWKDYYKQEGETLVGGEFSNEVGKILSHYKNRRQNLGDKQERKK